MQVTRIVSCMEHTEYVPEYVLVIIMILCPDYGFPGYGVLMEDSLYILLMRGRVLHK